MAIMLLGALNWFGNSSSRFAALALLPSTVCQCDSQHVSSVLSYFASPFPALLIVRINWESWPASTPSAAPPPAQPVHLHHHHHLHPHPSCRRHRRRSDCCSITCSSVRYCTWTAPTAPSGTSWHPGSRAQVVKPFSIFARRTHDLRPK